MLELKDKTIDLALEFLGLFILMLGACISSKVDYAFYFLFIVTCINCLELNFLKSQKQQIRSDESTLGWVIIIKFIDICFLFVLLFIFLIGIGNPSISVSYKLLDDVVSCSVIGLLLWCISMLLLISEPRKSSLKKYTLMFGVILLCIFVIRNVGCYVYHNILHKSIDPTIITLLVGIFLLQVLSCVLKTSYIPEFHFNCKMNEDKACKKDVEDKKNKLAFMFGFTKYPFTLSEALYKLGAMSQYTKFMSHYFPFYPDKRMVITNLIISKLDGFLSWVSPYVVVAVIWLLLYFCAIIVKTLCTNYFIAIYEHKWSNVIKKLN